MGRALIQGKGMSQSFFITIVAFLVLFLAGCKTSDNNMESRQTDPEAQAVRMEKVKGFEEYSLIPGTFCVAGDRAFCLGRKGEEWHLLAMSAEDQKVSSIAVQEEIRALCVHDAKEEIAGYVQKEDGSGRVLFLDYAGNCRKKLMVSPEIAEGQIPQTMCLNEAGDLLMLFDRYVYLWNEQGELLQKIVAEEKFLDIQGENDGFLLTVFNDMSGTGWVMKAVTGENVLQKTVKITQRPVFYQDYGIDWKKYGIIETEITGVSQVGDICYIWTNDWLSDSPKPLYVCMIPLKAGEGQVVDAEKKKITVVMAGMDQALDAMAIVYSRQNDVEVSVEHIGFEEDAWNLRLASRDNMDLVLLRMDYGMLQRAGYLEPLDPYLDRLGIPVEEMVPAFLSGWTTDGKIYGIPEDITIQVPYVRIPGREKQGACSIEKMLELLKTYPELKSENGLHPLEILRLCFYGKLETYLLPENDEKRFDTEKVGKLCKQLKDLSSDTRCYYMQWEDLLADGEAVFAESYLSSVSDLADLYQRCGDDLDFIGYPTEEGLLTSVVTSSSMCLVKKSEIADEALDFMRFYHENHDEYYHGDRWASNREELHKQIEEAGKEQILQDGTAWKLSEEQKQMILKIVEGARCCAPEYQEIQKIVMDELQGYFAGNRSLEQTLDIMNSRVRLYLAE